MDIRLNGEPRRVAGATLAELMTEQQIDSANPGIAVAINWAVVPRALWPTTPLKPGDEIEIVRPHSGG